MTGSRRSSASAASVRPNRCDGRDAVAGVAERRPGGQPGQPDDRGAVRGGDVDRPAPGVRHPASRELGEEAHEVRLDLGDDAVVDVHPAARPRAGRHPPAGPAEHDPVIARRPHVVQQRAPVGDRLAAAPAERVDHVRHRLGADDVAGRDREPVAQRRQRPARRVQREHRGAGAHASAVRGRDRDPLGRRAARRSRGCPRRPARRGRRAARAARTPAAPDGPSRPPARTRRRGRPASRSAPAPPRRPARAPSSPSTASALTPSCAGAVATHSSPAAPVPGVDALGLAPRADRVDRVACARPPTPAPPHRRSRRGATAG